MIGDSTMHPKGTDASTHQTGHLSAAFPWGGGVRETRCECVCVSEIH